MTEMEGIDIHMNRGALENKFKINQLVLECLRLGKSNVFHKYIIIELCHLYVRNYWLKTNVFRSNLIAVLTVLE